MKPIGENRITVKDEECYKTPDNQDYFTNTEFTAKPMDYEDKSTVFDIFEKTRLYSITHNK